MKKIYNQNKFLLSKIKSSIFELRKQNIYLGMKRFREFMKILPEDVIEVIEKKDYFNSELITVEATYIMEVLETITMAQNQKDYILLADLMELQLIPMLISWQEVIQSKEDVLQLEDNYEQNMRYLKEYNKDLFNRIVENPQINSEYIAEPTTNGSVTIKIMSKDNSFYLISNNDPQDAGRIFADTYYNPQKSNYILYGIELLNHVNALIENKNVPFVEVYEADLEMIKLAIRFGDLYHLTTNRLNIYYDPDLTKFADASQKEDMNNAVVMHHPSIRIIKDIGIREKFERLFLVDSSIRNQQNWMISNFISNVKHCNHYVDELLEQFRGKDVYLIAAGPSLDKNIHLLKNKPPKSVILAVGTVHRKLVNMGIVPDYTIFSDAQKTIKNQILGLNDLSFPIILLSTTYRELTTMNQGDHYLVCQYGYKDAEEYAIKNHHHLYETGGSVTTLALDVSIRLKARRIILLGADMAITNNLTHTTGTVSRMNIDKDGLFPVKSVGGGTVYTTRILDMYKEWIERRIAKEPNAEVIDATEGGALIKGTKICPLEKIIQETSIKK